MRCYAIIQEALFAELAAKVPGMPKREMCSSHLTKSHGAMILVEGDDALRTAVQEHAPQVYWKDRLASVRRSKA